MTSFILPYAKTAMMNLFLDHVSDVFADDFIVRPLDQAGWHTAHALKLPENIRLIPHPPYSPQLNPVEHIWEEVRAKWFPNRVFPSLSKVVDTLAAGLRHRAMLPELVRSMTYFPHFRVLR
jgi:hypothetical protein